MTRLVRQLKRFWQAEEVPRWFGISVVVIYLGGLAGVAQIGISYASQDRGRVYRQSGEHAHNLLAERLGTVDSTDTATLQRILRKFAASWPVLALRVLDGERQIVASIDASEIGSRSPVPEAGSLNPRRLEVIDLAKSEYATPARVLRAPIPIARAAGFSLPLREGIAQAKACDSGGPLYLEAVTTSDIPGHSNPAEHAGTLTVILCGCGALFVVYRRLRRQMRSVARIAHQLEAHGNRIREELSALRVADSAGALARQWNQLIDTVETLQDEVRRTKATGELSQVLAVASGGALAEALNTVQNGIIHIDEAGQVEYANATARRLLALSPDGATEETIKAMSPEGSGALLVEVIRSAWNDDGTIEPRNEIREVGSDDSSYRVRVLPLGGSRSVGGCLVTIDDVSQQVRADRAREDFVSQVTHELRTPLTNIRAYAETLSSGMFDDPKVVTECYNVITKETRRLSRLIEDILNVSQMEVGTIQLQIDTVDPGSLLTESVRDVRGLAEEKNIDLRLTLPAKLEPIRADRDKLAVVVNNLLGNALKYTPADGVVVVGCKISGSEVMITVKDNGIGIAPEDQQRVFEKFQRADDPDVQNQTGTGVGLYTAREISRRHGGDIELMSEKGSGSTFIVRLPHAPSRAAALTTGQE